MVVTARFVRGGGELLFWVGCFDKFSGERGKKEVERKGGGRRNLGGRETASFIFGWGRLDNSWGERGRKDVERGQKTKKSGDREGKSYFLKNNKIFKLIFQCIWTPHQLKIGTLFCHVII